jgi:dolichol-phosphate mannosyltransferase
MAKPSVSIILPTYNESENIVPLILAINKYVKARKEIIVVDDDSPDDTAGSVKKLIKKGRIKGLKLILRKRNHGLTLSIWEGILKSKGDIIVWMDCDFSHPPKIIPKLIHKIDRGYDIAVASRFVSGGGFKKNLKDSNDSILAVSLSRIMNYVIQLALDGSFKDYTSGFIAIKRKVFKDIKLKGDYGEYFVDLMTRAILLDYKFIEIPFVNLPRKYGESKTGTSIFKLVKRGTKYITLAINLLFLKIGYKIGLIDDIRSQAKTFK